MTATYANSALVVEDEIFVVLDVEDCLSRYDLDEVHSVSTVSGALAWLKQNRPKFAVVDYRLRDTTSEALAARLTELNIPTVIYSGNTYSPDLDDPSLSSFEWVEKPATAKQLAAAIDRALSKDQQS